MVKGRKEERKRVGSNLYTSTPSLYLHKKIKKININRLFYNRVELALRRALSENCQLIGWTDIHLTNKGMHSINGNTSKGKRKISPSPPTKRKKAQPPLTSFGFTLTPIKTKEPKEKVISNNDIPNTVDNETNDNYIKDKCIPKKKRKCSETNKESEINNKIIDYYESLDHNRTVNSFNPQDHVLYLKKRKSSNPNKESELMAIFFYMGIKTIHHRKFFFSSS